ncbi:integrase [Pseudoxanthomonas mexicana]
MSEQSRGKKYRLNTGDIRALSLQKVPQIVGGKTKVVALPADETPKPYRFLDATPGAPVGFGVYVGQRGTSFEVGRRVRGKFIRVALGSANDMTLERAHELARQKLAVILETGESPKRQEAIAANAHGIRTITVRECMQRYIQRLDGKVEKRTGKAKSVDGARNSLARLERPEVGLADRQVRDLDGATLLAAWDGLRGTCMRLSNQLPSHIKNKLDGIERWWTLTLAEFNTLGITGKYIQRAQSAGASATEHTFGDLGRAIDRVMREERKNAQREGRVPELQFNPIEDLRDEGMFRSNDQLADHYRKAQVRNPLGEDNKTLPTVLKTLLGRRDQQGGNNRVGVDYLLLTLLFGSRRNEAAQLHWYDRCSSDELTTEGVSWVWLADDPSQLNPTTRKPGSQAFFHDMKGKEVRFLPVAYFAERILRNRLRERDDELAKLPARIKAAEKVHARAIKQKDGDEAVADAARAVETLHRRQHNLRFVFPARSSRAKDGHYKDSKSLLRNVRRDAGLVDLRQDIDVGLTPHDLRRTLGRYAERRYKGGRLVSQILHHKVRSNGAAVTDLYNSQEWSDMREAISLIEEDMIATSPRVWNALRGADKLRMDEQGDPIVVLTRGGPSD